MKKRLRLLAAGLALSWVLAPEAPAALDDSGASSATVVGTADAVDPTADPSGNVAGAVSPVGATIAVSEVPGAGRFTGTVTSVDPAGGRITLRDEASGIERSVTGSVGSEIAAGDRVDVRMRAGSQNEAASVTKA